KKELVETYTVTADDWSLEIEDLPSFDKDGKAYTYEIEEKSVEGYETSINGFEITNVRTGTTEVSGTKEWEDNQDATGSRPDLITVQLKNGEEIVQEQEVRANEDGEWKYSFSDLPKFDEEGKEINYTVQEVAVEGYRTNITGFTITNTLKTY